MIKRTSYTIKKSHNCAYNGGEGYKSYRNDLECMSPLCNILFINIKALGITTSKSRTVRPRKITVRTSRHQVRQAQTKYLCFSKTPWPMAE